MGPSGNSADPARFISFNEITAPGALGRLNPFTRGALRPRAVLPAQRADVNSVFVFIY